MSQNLYFTKEHEQVRTALRDFVNKRINPFVDEWEAKGAAPLHALFKEMGELGFLGIRYDERYGGEGLDYWYETVMLEEIARARCGGVPMAIAVQTNMATPAIAEFGSDTAELYFDDLRIPAENLIGREGEGFIYQMRQFQHERFSALPICYIGAEEMIRETVAYIKGRIVFGKPLITKQVLRHRLVDWLSEIECLRQLTYHIVRLKMAGQDATREISMGKLVGGRLLNQVADGCLQMHGGMGFMNEMRVSRFFRDARLIAIGAGASEVMSDIIAKLEGF